MIGYVTLGTNDIARAAVFYDAIAAELETPRMMEYESFIAWGKPGAAGIGLTKPFDGNDATVGFAGSQGNFQLNVYKPVMAHAVLESIRLIADSCVSFDENCAVGIEPVTEVIEANLERNLMVVTALNRHIGYDKAAAMAKKAHKEGTSLREAAIASGDISGEDFDAWVVPADMTHPSAS